MPSSSEGRRLCQAVGLLPRQLLPPAVASSARTFTAIPQPELCAEDSGPGFFEESVILNERSGYKTGTNLSTSPGSGCWCSALYPWPLPPPPPPSCWKDYGVRMGVSHVLREELDKQRPSAHWRKVNATSKTLQWLRASHFFFFKNIYNKHIQGL